MKSLQDALQDIRKTREEMDRFNQRLPDIIGIEALNAIDQNFENESYNSGAGITRWPKRKAATNKAYDRRSGGLKGSVFNSGNKILQQTGNLRAAVRKIRKGQNVFIGVNLLKIPYAHIHNEGGTISMKGGRVLLWGSKGFTSKWGGAKRGKVSKAHTITMPQRQYMPTPGQGPNPMILKKAKAKIEFEQNRIMNKFRR